jgi:hypothetical protein
VILRELTGHTGHPRIAADLLIMKALDWDEGELLDKYSAICALVGPSWGRETAVNNGQPRCPADNQTYSSSAVISRDGAAGPYLAWKRSEPDFRRGAGRHLPAVTAVTAPPEPSDHPAY